MRTSRFSTPVLLTIAVTAITITLIVALVIALTVVGRQHSSVAAGDRAAAAADTDAGGSIGTDGPASAGDGGAGADGGQPAPDFTSDRGPMFFELASDNIRCKYENNVSFEGIRCEARNFTFPTGMIEDPTVTPPSRMGPMMTPDGEIHRSGGTDSGLFNDGQEGIPSPIAPGEATVHLGIACTVTETSVTCQNAAGRGFFLSQDEMRDF